MIFYEGVDEKMIFYEGVDEKMIFYEGVDGLRSLETPGLNRASFAKG